MLVSVRLSLLIVALAAAACAPSVKSGHRQLEDVSLTPVQLISQVEALQGQRVTVQGYFTYVVDTRALWESKTDHLNAREQRLGPDADYWAKCITVYLDGMAAGSFNGRSVMVTGNVVVIDKDDFRSLWTCNAVALENAVISPR